jgi:nucleotide-binding universal stress UspA family protein
MSRVSASEDRSPERSVVVGYDGSDSAGRPVARSVRSAGPRGKVVVVTVDPRMLSDGIVAEPLIEAGVPPSQLLADAREIAAAPRATEIRTEARQGNPADEILEVARAAHADLIVIGRTGKSFVAREILGSVALRVVKVALCDVLVVA